VQSTPFRNRAPSANSAIWENKSPWKTVSVQVVKIRDGKFSNGPVTSER
jgi:hypothetical protein